MTPKRWEEIKRIALPFGDNPLVECVAEIERMRSVLAQYANHKNWERIEDGDLKNFTAWTPGDIYGYFGGDGWELADEALKGTGDVSK